MAEFAPGSRGERMALAGLEGQVTIVHALTSNSEIQWREHAGPVRALSWSPDGSWLGSGGDDLAIRIWHPTEPERKTVLKGHMHPITSLSVDREGRRLASASKDHSVRLWAFCFRGHDSEVNCVAFHPCLARVATADAAGRLLIWSTDGTTLHRCHEHSAGIDFLRRSSDGKHLVTAERNGAIRVWDSETGRCINSRTMAQPIPSLRLVHDDRLLIPQHQPRPSWAALHATTFPALEEVTQLSAFDGIQNFSRFAVSPDADALKP